LEILDVDELEVLGFDRGHRNPDGERRLSFQCERHPSGVALRHRVAQRGRDVLVADLRGEAERTPFEQHDRPRSGW
jgi:hypothetical protein